MSNRRETHGYTIVELLIAIVLFASISVLSVSFFVSMLSAMALSKRKAVALTLAINRVEQLRSLPYDELAVVGGVIYSPAPLASTETNVVDGLTYTIKTNINYVDNAYDNCGSYPSAALMLTYCRDSKSTSLQTDTNPKDYKIARVQVLDDKGTSLAETDTTVSARVAESASTTGALFVTVIDGKGNPVQDATAIVTNTSVTPAINATNTTDKNGIAIFYDFPPDATGKNYVISVSKPNFSSLVTIAAVGSNLPTYPNQQIFTQQSSSVTMVINPMHPKSLVLESVTTSGSPLASMKVYIKGGDKKFSEITNSEFYYDTMSPSDMRPTTDGSGQIGITNLTPGPYYFCGENGDTGCFVGATKYYLGAAVPYGGVELINPTVISANDGSPLAIPRFSYGSDNYIQKTRLIFSPSQSAPRVKTITPASVSKSGIAPLSASLQLTGVNLSCDPDSTLCATSVIIAQGATTYTASCTGDSVGTSLSCLVDLSAASVGPTDIIINNGSGTLRLPGSPLLGSINVEI